MLVLCCNQPEPRLTPATDSLEVQQAAYGISCVFRSGSDSEEASPPQAVGKAGSNTVTSDSTNFPSFAALRARVGSAAPAVDTKDLVLSESGDPTSAVALRTEKAPAFNTKTLKYNPKYEDLYGGNRGGSEAEEQLRKALRNHTSGFVEDTSVPSAIFEQQYNDFNSTKVAETPGGQRFGDVQGMHFRSCVSPCVSPCASLRSCPHLSLLMYSDCVLLHVWRFHVVNMGPCAGKASKRRRTEAEVIAERAAREEKRAAKEAALTAQREAAAGGGAFRLKAVQPWADKESKQEELTEEQKEYLAKVEAEKKAKEAAKEKTESVRHPAQPCCHVSNNHIHAAVLVVQQIKCRQPLLEQPQV